MTTKELEQVIQEYLMDIYHKKYIGKLDIQKLDPIGYCIKFGINYPEKPMVIYGELKDEDFIKYLKRELKDRRFNLIYYGKLFLTQPYNCEPINKSCNCNDQGCTNRENRQGNLGIGIC